MSQTDGKKFTGMPLGEAGSQPWIGTSRSLAPGSCSVWVAEAPGAKRPSRGAAAAKQLGSAGEGSWRTQQDSGWGFRAPAA